MGVIQNYPHNLGMNCLSTALKDIMEYNGYKYSEDFCMGLSGAFSFWYTKSNKFIQITGLGNNIFEELPAITKVQHQYLRFEDNKKAWKAACEYIDHEIPVIFDVELAAYVSKIDAMCDNSKVEKKMLSVFDSIEFRVGGHVTTFLGYDKYDAYLAENMFYKPVKVPIDVIMNARNPGDIEFVPPYNGMHIFYFPEKLPKMEYMIRTAIIRTINNMELPYTKPKYCYDGLSYEASGLKGMQMFFEDIIQIVKAKTPEGYRQMNALAQISNRWGGNEVNRAAYSRFLKTAAKLLNNEKLDEVAITYVETSKEWKLFLQKINAYINKTTEVDETFFIESMETILRIERKALEELHSIVEY